MEAVVAELEQEVAKLEKAGAVALRIQKCVTRVLARLPACLSLPVLSR